MGYRKDNQYRNYNKKNTRDYDHKTRKPDTKGASPSHVTITPKNNEPIERTIKRFLRKVKKSGIADEYKKRRFFEKPSTKRRKQKLRREATIKKLRQKEGK
jgi:small subunit ribosomal protein S21